MKCVDFGNHNNQHETKTTIGRTKNPFHTRFEVQLKHQTFPSQKTPSSHMLKNDPNCCLKTQPNTNLIQCISVDHRETSHAIQVLFITEHDGCL